MKGLGANKQRGVVMADEIPVGTAGCDLSSQRQSNIKVVVYFHIPRREAPISAEQALSQADNASRAQSLAADIAAVVKESYSEE
jgi:hypothetical protein